jgi:hypothetical protein
MAHHGPVDHEAKIPHSGDTYYDHRLDDGTEVEVCPRCNGSGHDPKENLVRRLVCCGEWGEDSCGNGPPYCSGPQARLIESPKACEQCGGDGLTQNGRQQKVAAGMLDKDSVAAYEVSLVEKRLHNG